jgi:hypothetical protein
MRKCAKYEELLARFIHGELLLQEKEDLESHIAVCSSCEMLYQEMTDADRVLRAVPEKLIDPPPYLRGRILANLPEPKTAGWFGEKRGWWTAALGGALACALLAFAIYRAEVPREERVAQVPAPAVSPEGVSPDVVSPEGAVPSPGVQPPGREEAIPSPDTRVAAPAPVPVPGGQAVPKKKSSSSVVASAPKVRIIHEVRVYFYYPPARKVTVTGDFNGWDPQGVPLRSAGKPGLWETTLRLKPGAYSYNFIVDGSLLVPDPNSPNQMPDGYGGTNSIMMVRGGDSV